MIRVKTDENGQKHYFDGGKEVKPQRKTHKDLLNKYDFVFGNYKELQEKRRIEREAEKFKYQPEKL
jgi:hypothetical protein